MMLLAILLIAAEPNLYEVSNSVMLDICAESEDLKSPKACYLAELEYLGVPLPKWAILNRARQRKAT